MVSSECQGTIGTLLIRRFSLKERDDLGVSVFRSLSRQVEDVGFTYQTKTER